MNNLPLFNVEQQRQQAQVLKRVGMEAAASYPADKWVLQARDKAVEIAIKYGEVSADDIYQAIRLGDLEPRPNINCMGSVFQDKRLMFTGRMKQSNRRDRHGAWNRVWTYRR